MGSWDGRKAMAVDMSSIVGENWGGGKWSHRSPWCLPLFSLVDLRRWHIFVFALRPAIFSLLFSPVAHGELIQEMIAMFGVRS